ncbi:right-handed parallel beta-helix repeat-containing protein [Polymorphobacter megasporae]|uniref:right-handed parallel beta-helix repeat-containing protein n=1 Tax=Glacieibacterium megasporae TaxID=2835787 RepID=UPI001C1E585C|nr:right-handed parallel beta-helix repeat-containing protein [Polymorphobacter megasporae]UAJ12690.1 right-handed parallel beta-helix repeat-containing protein [Polymorphobacter megasporae]
MRFQAGTLLGQSIEPHRGACPIASTGTLNPNLLKSAKVCLLIAALALSTTTRAAILSVTKSTIGQVFDRAESGDTLRLIGDFDRIELKGRNFAPALVIDGDKATFQDTLLIRDVQGLILHGGLFRSNSGSTALGRWISVYGGSRILIDQVRIEGAGTGRGILFTSTKNASVINSLFVHLSAGVGFIDVDEGYIYNNISSRSTSDGFNVVASHHVKVSSNTCADTNRSEGAHPDCVQMWSLTGHVPLSDIEISNNLASGGTQGFTLFNPKDGGADRVSIIGNRIDTTFPQGIACYNCRDSEISGNHLSTMSGAKNSTTIHVFGGENNRVAHNIMNEPSGKNYEGVGANPVWSLGLLVDGTFGFNKDEVARVRELISKKLTSF